jgi:hypothetical protein
MLYPVPTGGTVPSKIIFMGTGTGYKSSTYQTGSSLVCGCCSKGRMKNRAGSYRYGQIWINDTLETRQIMQEKLTS